MDAYSKWLNSLINDNKKRFSEFSDVNWLNPYKTDVYQRKRNKLLGKIEDKLLFAGTKPFHFQISKGCKLCGEGEWSCLFITGKCNANCFYCPTSQLNDETPATQSLSFDTAEAYADYINFFGFKGVSFSGGEPLLFFDRTLHYLKTIRERCDPNIYTWIYTNGILAETRKFEELAAAGLNEIRFDIGATGFKLDKIKPAKDIIPNITIEIPAIPEEKEKLKRLLPEMQKAGVSNLNLHQLRLTKYNAPKLLKRKYTYLSAEQPIVLESELAALEIVAEARGKNMDIGINYCSFHFKNRFQKAGFRTKVAQKFEFENHKITQQGFIRDYDKEKIGYNTIRLADTAAGFKHSSELKLAHKSIFYAIEPNMPAIVIPQDLHVETEKLLQQQPNYIPENELLFKIWQKEYIEAGLRDY
jgi:pyruvate formate-lyase activating enzyme-like uncharacterized protein